MHNGGIADFQKIKRRLQSYVPDDIFNMVNGNTGLCRTLTLHPSMILTSKSPDSQWAFALFLSKASRLLSSMKCGMSDVTSQLPNPYAKSYKPDVLRQAMLETIASINLMTEEAGITEVSTSYRPRQYDSNSRSTAEPPQLLHH